MIDHPSRPRGGFFLCLIALFMAAVTPALGATLLPPGKQVFVNANGAPLAGGQVFFYIPATTTPKNTWQDAAQTILNTNPVTLDIAGSAIVYGTGCYREIVKDAAGNTIWDQPTCDTSSSNLIWAGHSGGTSNNQTLTAPNFTSADGQTIAFIAGASNTSALGLTINGGTSINVLKDLIAAAVSLSGGEVVSGNLVMATYDATRGAFHLVNNPVVGANPVTAITGSGTTDVGASGSQNVQISGSATINSFGSSASTSFPLYHIRFGVGASTLVNSGSLALPSATNITTAAGDFATAWYAGSGNWIVGQYTRSNATSLAAQPIRQTVLSCPSSLPTSGGYLPSRVDVQVIGAGGGGGGNGNDGATGGSTTFNGVTANGGGGGTHSVNAFGTDGGAGGTGGGGSADIRLAGQPGMGGGANEGGGSTGTAGEVAGNGGRAASAYSWGGMMSGNNTTARQNGGWGGGGAGAVLAAAIGNSSGGGGGEYAEFSISNPTSPITCSIGAGGAGGTSAGAGGGGIIFIRNYWN